MKIRVACNPYTSKMSYYFRNEIGERDVLSGSSRFRENITQMLQLLKQQVKY